MIEHLNELEREIQNRWADGYDAIFFERPAAVSNLRAFRAYLDQRIAEHFGRYSPAERRQLRILDAGCGTGELLSQLKRDGFTNLYGMDLSERMVERASQKCPGVSFAVGSFDSAGPPLGQFDIIIGTEWLHHVPILRPVFQRAYDLLAPGGFFCGMEPYNGWLFQQVGLRQSILTLIFGPMMHLMAFKNRAKIKALIELEGDRGYTSWHRHLSLGELSSPAEGLGFKLQTERRFTVVTYFGGALFNTAMDRFIYRLLQWLDVKLIDRMGRGGYVFLCAVKSAKPNA